MNLPDGPIIKREPALAHQVTDFLKSQIEKGELAPGDILPSELELADLLQVSRTVVREALALMKHDGLIESRKGGRTKVADDPAGWVFRLDIESLEDKNYLTNLYELRLIVEPEAAALSAVRAGDKDLARIRKRLDKLNQARDQGRDATRESITFHEAMMNAAGNPHLAKFVAWLGMKFFSCIRAQVFEINKEYISLVRKEHEAIVRALEERNPAKARKSTRNHLLLSARRHGIDLNMP